MKKDKDSPFPYNFFPEIIRYAKLKEMKESPENEYDAAVYATWYTRDRDDRELKHTEGSFQFTAHVHPQEPLVPSPDDLEVYRDFRRSAPEDAEIVHFIIDGYTCRRADESGKPPEDGKVPRGSPVPLQKRPDALCAERKPEEEETE